jgi:hypothetical protein
MVAKIEIRLTRTTMQTHAGKSRTYGSYGVTVDGVQEPGLDGYICECHGPGDNQHAGSGCRIAAGSYGVATHYGRYVSEGYSDDLNPPLPGLALGNGGSIGQRRGILLHPAHRPHLYLSSIGCLNPTSAIGADHDIDPEDSRARVIALVQIIKQHNPAAFAKHEPVEIPDCTIVIEGEP